MPDNHNLIDERGCHLVKITPQSDVLQRPITSRYTIILMCLEGEVEYEMNLERFEAHAGERITFPHVSMLKGISMSQNFSAVALVMDDEFSIEASTGIDTTVVANVFGTPIRKVDNPKVWDMMKAIMASIEQYQQLDDDPSSRLVTSALVRALLLVICESEGQLTNITSTATSSGDVYFRSFINMLSEHVAAEHEVTYYAEQLNISPKYLGEICKAKSGHKAKEIISTVLIANIKREILVGALSMREISEKFGFSDQSSLGKFFRKMVGISPLAFRRQNTAITH